MVLRKDSVQYLFDFAVANMLMIKSPHLQVRKSKLKFWVLNMLKVERLVSFHRGQIIFQSRLYANAILN